MKKMANGTRVALHPCTDEWMQGDKYGTVVGYGRKREYINRDTKQRVTVQPVRVELDSGRVRNMHPEWIVESFTQ